MVSSQNPWSDPGPPGGPESLFPPPQITRAAEDPIWSGWDVLRIVGVTIIAVFFLLLVVMSVAQVWLFPRMPTVEVAKNPLISVVAQFLAYVVVLAYMVSVVHRYDVGSFWAGVKWGWPKNWAAWILLGGVLSVALQGFAHLLPIPKQLPMDRFFETAKQAWVLSIFGMTFAPLLEELFFRGFLYPVLTRRLGITLGVLLTAIAFGLLHAQQLGEAWAPILIVFLVGLALTIVRAVTKSVAPGFLMHVAYNATISALLYVGTDGFRHLEKLNR